MTFDLNLDQGQVGVKAIWHFPGAPDHDAHFSMSKVAFFSKWPDMNGLNKFEFHRDEGGRSFPSIVKLSEIKGK